MLRLLTKGLLILLLNLSVAVALLGIHDARLHYSPWETDSRLLTMPANASTDLVFLGSSRAYLFSRFRDNHSVVERVLNSNVVNLAMPTGGGVRPAHLFFGTFLKRNNRTGAVIYFLDPFVFYNWGGNDAHKFVYFEPFQLTFAARLVSDGYPARQIFAYFRSKFSRDWLFQHPKPLVAHTGRVNPEDITGDRIRQRFDTLFPKDIPDGALDRFFRYFEDIVKQCESQGLKLYVVFMPTLLGQEPHSAEVFERLRGLQKRHPFEMHDFVNAMPNPNYFYNLDHLNTAGVEHFMTHFVRPMLKETA